MAYSGVFEAFFLNADADRDGRISGVEAINFFSAADLSQPTLAKIWEYANQSQTGFLSRQEFYNALKLATVAQTGRELTPELVKAALSGPAAAQIPPPRIPLSSIFEGAGAQPPTSQSTPLPANHGTQFARPANTGPPKSNSNPELYCFGEFSRTNSLVGDMAANCGPRSLPASSLGFSKATSSVIITSNPQICGYDGRQQAAAAPAPPNSPWPKMTPSDAQRFVHVFSQVDTDHDGQVTGEQARQLFLSWQLPREVLRHVWNLSDEDGDSMLSVREFCTAVYLLEKFTEGWPLPSRLPTGIHLDEPPTPASKVFAPELLGSGESSWRLPQGRLPPTDFAFKPRQSSAQDCYALSTTSERHLQDPLVSPVKVSPGRSSCMFYNSKTPHANSRFLNLNCESEEALTPTLRESEKLLVTPQVADFTKRIMSQKEKAEYYRSKLQEIMLFKSQCTDKVAEMTEKVIACKHEANTLNQQCHKMSKSASDVETEIAAAVPTLKHIQEKKRELSRALLRLDSESRVSESHFQTQLDHIAVHLRKLTTMLLVRAKSLGVEIKRQLPKNTPFGWQANIQENAAEWEKGWDTFNDEAFTEVQEHISPTPEESLLAVFTGEVYAAASAKVEEVRPLELDIVDCRLQLEPSQEQVSSVLESSDTPSASVRPTGAPNEKSMHSPVYNEKPRSTSETLADKAAHINFRMVPGSTAVAEALTRDAADSHPPLAAESAIETFTNTFAICVPPPRSHAAESSSEVTSQDAFGGNETVWKMGQKDDNADSSLRSPWELPSSSRRIQSPAEIKASGRASRSRGSFEPEDYFDLFPPRDPTWMSSLSGRSLAMASERTANHKSLAGHDNFETFGFLVYTMKESSESPPILTTSSAQPFDTPVITDHGPHEYPREGLTVFDESSSDAASSSVSGK